MGTKGRRDKRGGGKEERIEGEKSCDSEEARLIVIVWLLCSPEPWIFQWNLQGYCLVAVAIEPNTSHPQTLSVPYFFKNQIFSPWYLGRGVCRWGSPKNYNVNALYSAIFCMCVHGWPLCIHVQRPEVDVGCLPLWHFTLAFETNSLWTCGPPVRLGWLASELPGSAHLPPSTWVVGLCQHAWQFTNECWGAEPRSRCLCYWHFTHRAIPPSLCVLFYYQVVW